MTTKESLVEVSPSTVMQLKLWSAASFASCASRPAANPASVATKPSMVAMLGRIMPAPLLMPVTVMILPPSSMTARGGLGHGVGGHDGVRRRVPVVGRKIGLRRRQPGDQALHRQVFEDHAGRKRQHLGALQPSSSRHGIAGLARRAHALLAGRGIGDAGIDHQRAQAAVARQVLAAQRHRRRAAAIPGKHPGGPTARRQLDQRQVAPVLLADAGLGGAEAHAGDGEQGFRGGSGVVDGHGLACGADSKESSQFSRPRPAPQQKSALAGRLLNATKATATLTPSPPFTGWASVVTKSLTRMTWCNYNKRMIVWDESKRKKNLKDHGIDLAEVACVFDAPKVTVEDEREHHGEQRLQSLAWFRNRVVFLVWTERNDSARVISCRYGDKHETRAYFEALDL
jgi:uncharacterized DUF497 family protein